MQNIKEDQNVSVSGVFNDLALTNTKDKILNLDTLETSLNTSIELSKILDSQKNSLICESGIHTVDNVKSVVEKAGIYNFLIGESLLKSKDIGLQLKMFTQINT